MPGAFNLRDLGRRIRAARLARRLTLDDVVSRADFTVSWLSKVENGLLAPSLEGLVRIAEILECGVEPLVAGLAATPRVVVTRREARRGGRKVERLAGTMTEQLCQSWPSRTMDPVIVHLCGDDGGHAPVPHEGQRFVHALEGSIQVAYGDERIGLAAGDSAYLDAAIPLVITARGGSARVLCVSSDPTHATGRPGRAATRPRRSAPTKRG